MNTKKETELTSCITSDNAGITGDLIQEVSCKEITLLKVDKKIPIVCLSIIYSMLLWILLQPGSEIFMAIRLGIAWISVVCIHYSYFRRDSIYTHFLFLICLYEISFIFSEEGKYYLFILGCSLILTLQLGIIYFVRYTILKFLKRMVKISKQVG